MSGTGTPVSPGAPGRIGLAQPTPYTLLSLGRYAQIMGIPPIHFWSATAPGTNPQVLSVSGCDSIWWKYDWQDADKVSRSQLLEAIWVAEQEIAAQLGYYPAPMWVEGELHQFPRPYLRQYYGAGMDIRAQYKSIRTTYGEIMEIGHRSVELLGTATTAGLTLVYSDNDGDGLEETATVTMTTTYTDECAHKLYYTGHGGDQEWEIRPYRSVSIAAGVVTFVLDSWLLIDPDLYEVFPTSDGITAIDISDTTNYVASVDVYYEYSETILPSAVFYYEPYPCTSCGSTGSGCEACSDTTQNGCAHIRDAANGLIVPTPATYDATSGAWISSTWDGCREPDRVRVWYRAGLTTDRRWMHGQTCDPLSIEMARMIAYLATARLERPFCNCGNAVALSNYLREDMAESGGGGPSRFMPRWTIDSPFGTRRGEVYAWRTITRFMPEGRRLGVALV